MPRISIDAVMAKAKQAFPASGYGIGKLFWHPGVRVSPYISSGSAKLLLHSDVTRRKSEGRYRDAYDCRESSYYLMRLLHESGFDDARCVDLPHPLYTTDVSVISQDRLLSLTPGIRDEDFSGVNPLLLKSLRVIPFDEMERVWRLRESVYFELGEGAIPLDWTSFNGFGFLNSFYVTYRLRPLHFNFSFITTLANHGMPQLIFRRDFMTCLGLLEALQKKLAKTQETGVLESVPVYPNYDMRCGSVKEGDIEEADRINLSGAYRYLAQFIRIMDSEFLRHSRILRQKYIDHIRRHDKPLPNIGNAPILF